MKKKKQVDPEQKQMLAELEDVALRLGFKVRYEKGNFAGGYCILRDSRLLVVNSRNEIERRIIIVAKSLKEIGIDDVFVKPSVRELIEKESARKVTGDEVTGDVVTGDEVTEEAEVE